MSMKHVVVVWGTDLHTEDELQAFLEPVYTEDGDMYPSEFMKATGLTWVDEDFFEVHAVAKAEERADFWSICDRSAFRMGKFLPRSCQLRFPRN